MAFVDYTYSITEDFVGLVEPTPNINVLQEEIENSSITIALSHIDSNQTEIIIWFKASLSTEEENILDGIIPSHTGEYTVEEETLKVHMDSDYHPLDNLGRPLQALQKPIGDGVHIYLFNLCDKTTWWYDHEKKKSLSLTRTDETHYSIPLTLTEGGSALAIVDATHGKITQESFIKDKDYSDTGTDSYRDLSLHIFVDGVEVIENSPGTSDGDWSCDYRTGGVIFNSSIPESSVVTCNCRLVKSSLFVITPPSSGMLQIDVTDIQFSTDTILTTTIEMKTFGSVKGTQYLPGGDLLYQALSAVYPNDFKVEYETIIPKESRPHEFTFYSFEYKGFSDFMNDALKALPQYIKMGVGETPNPQTDWRGLSNSTIVFNWDYAFARYVCSILETEIRISLKDDIELNGSTGTATFYCSIMPPKIII